MQTINVIIVINNKETRIIEEHNKKITPCSLDRILLEFALLLTNSSVNLKELLEL